MSIPLEALVGELHISGGARQSVSRPTGSFAAPRRAARGRADDLLFVLVELRGPDPLPYQELVERIEAAYWRTPGTVTSALRAALVIANDWLMDRNVPLDVADRVRAGVSCAALRVREAEVLIAQAGPAAAYVAHHGQVERFPAREVTAPAMGASRGVEVRFSRAELSPGDMLLLCDSATAERETDQSIAEAIVYTGVQAALQNIAKLAGSNDLIALVIEGAAERRTKAALATAVQATRPVMPAPLPQPVAEAPIEEKPQPAKAPEIKPPTAEARIEAEKARWEQRMDERSVSLNRGPRIGEAEPIKPPEPQLAAPQSQVETNRPPEAVEETEPVTLAQRLSGLASRWRPQPGVEPQAEAGAETETVSWRQRLGERMAGLNLGERARAIGGSLKAGGIVAARGIATVLQRTLPEGTISQQPGKTVETVLITFAVVIPLVVFVLVAASYKQYSTLEHFQSLLSSARNEAVQAAAISDPAARRARWVSSLDQARSALEIFPDDSARKVRDEAQYALDQIDIVVRLAPTLLWDFKSLGQQRVAVQGANLFVLDKASNRVFQLTLTEAGDAAAEKGEPPTRAYKTQAVNERQVGDLIDLVWMPLGGTRTRSSLLILDSGGLLDYDLAWNLRAVALGQGQVPSGARAVAAFGGNLYVLDAVGNQLLRYRPQGDGYGGTPESYFEKPPGDLSSALDMAIDGNVYLLLADSRIRKFFGGAEKTFAITGLNEPIKKPVALALDADARQSTVYVAEAGRVVQFSPDGMFIRQFRPATDAFDLLQDLVVDGRNGRMFAVSGGKLYVARLPALP